MPLLGFERKVKDEPDLSKPEDLVLLTLYLAGKRIEGATVFHKLIFVLTKEHVKRLFYKFKFVPWRFGPWSLVLDTLLKRLALSGLINISRDGKMLIYSLTPHGINRVETQILNKLPPEEVMKIKNKIEFLLQAGYEGILGYVYENYPEYAVNSEIRDKL